MGNSSYKKTREAYTLLLEKIVDASLRLGLELNLQQQSALAMLLESGAWWLYSMELVARPLVMVHRAVT